MVPNHKEDMAILMNSFLLLSINKCQGHKITDLDMFVVYNGSISGACMPELKSLTLIQVQQLWPRLAYK